VCLRNVDASWKSQAMHWDLALALEPNIMVHSIAMSWQRVCLPLKSYIVDFDDQVAA
jgi:hypothetical protein